MDKDTKEGLARAFPEEFGRAALQAVQQGGVSVGVERFGAPAELISYWQVEEALAESDSAPRQGRGVPTSRADAGARRSAVNLTGLTTAASPTASAFSRLRELTCRAFLSRTRTHKSGLRPEAARHLTTQH
jgi:hypothetical protein